MPQTHSPNRLTYLLVLVEQRIPEPRLARAGEARDQNTQRRVLLLHVNGLEKRRVVRRGLAAHKFRLVEARPLDDPTVRTPHSTEDTRVERRSSLLTAKCKRAGQ